MRRREERRREERAHSDLLLVGEGGVHKLPVEHTGALGVRRQQPYDKGYLQLKVKWKPEDGITGTDSKL